MSQIELLPLVTGLLAFASVVYFAIADGPVSKHLWLFPAGISLLFLLISLQAMFAEGPMGFWTEHTRSLWGNQIWFDLLLGVSSAFAFIVSRAKKMEMRVILWALLCLTTGSIGLYAFIGRLLYLEARRTDDAVD